MTRAKDISIKPLISTITGIRSGSINHQSVSVQDVVLPNISSFVFDHEEAAFHA